MSIARGRAQVFAGMLGLVAVLSGACGNSDTQPHPTRSPTEPSEQPRADECTPGGDCVCDGTWPGTYACDAHGSQVCECEACQAPPVVKAPVVEGCSGYPFGTWKLKHVDVEATPLEITVDGASRGQCPRTFTLAEEPARLIMTLHESGVADYESEILPVKMSYSESCVVSKVAAFSCGSEAWTGVSNCHVACDTCFCDTTTGAAHTAQGMWTRTEQSLRLDLIGDGAEDYAYCMSGDELQLSAPGVRLVYARFNQLAKPVPCSSRSAAECVASEADTCTLGACVGDASCSAAPSEETCLAAGGCAWDDATCSGKAPADCKLADYGVVPGCGLTSECRGTPEPCADRVGSCRAGCNTRIEGHCSGGPLKCASYSFCPSRCLSQLIEYPCANGEIACEELTRVDCESTAINYTLEPCHWTTLTQCEGAPEPCESVPLEECNGIPGCFLATKP